MRIIKRDMFYWLHSRTKRIQYQPIQVPSKLSEKVLMSNEVLCLVKCSESEKVLVLFNILANCDPLAARAYGITRRAFGHQSILRASNQTFPANMRGDEKSRTAKFCAHAKLFFPISFPRENVKTSAGLHFGSEARVSGGVTFHEWIPQ